MKKILILGGGQWQTNLILAVKKLGYISVVADQNKSCIGSTLADFFWNVSITDRNKLIVLSKNFNIDLVLTDSTDRAVIEMAAINDALSIPGIKPLEAIRFTNKLQMRNALYRKIKMPEYYEVSNSRKEILKKFNTISGPAIVKPLYGQSSIGVKKICSEEDILLLDFAKDFINAQELILEEYIEGTEYTVDSITLNKETNITAVSKKTHYDDNECVANSLIFDIEIQSDLYKSLKKIHTDIIKFMNLENSLCHAEYIVKNNIPYLVEIAARGGGTGVSSIIAPYISGLRHYELLINSLLGNNYEIKHFQENRYAALKFFEPKQGYIEEIMTPRKEYIDKNIDLFQFNAKIGDNLGNQLDDKKRNDIGYYIVLNDSRDKLYEIINRVDSETKVVTKYD